jgi:hypothetical protein
VSIITVNYNQTAVTCALLDSIQRQKHPSVQVIVVDNASRENPRQALEARCPGLVFLRSEANLGFAGGNNLALPHATGDYLFFVNNDAELCADTIPRLLRFFQEHPRAGIVSPLICYFPEAGAKTDLIQYAGMPAVQPLTGRSAMLGNGTPDLGQYAQPMPTGYAHGAAMMVPRQVLERVGPMEDSFFLYYEEVDWSERIRRAGFEVWVEPRAKVHHKESLTVAPLGPLKTYYLSRNRVFFMRRNFGGLPLLLFYLFLFCVTIPKNTAIFALRRDWPNLRAFLRGVFWNFKGRPAAQAPLKPQFG